MPVLRIAPAHGPVVLVVQKVKPLIRSTSLLEYLWIKCGDFAYSTLWFREDGSIPSWWIPGPAKYGQPHEPIDFEGNVLVRFTALRFPA